ncbi:hypothetical protein GCM10010302_05750 [Streptomyces polychromogenes]|uniref:Uncharacterized protein n=1 Tax=Streptomyces polychromogenes TaxID=67342 RepID=A0ABP3EQL8_9ACTN
MSHTITNASSLFVIALARIARRRPQFLDWHRDGHGYQAHDYKAPPTI